MINLSDTLISDLYVGTSQVSAAFLGDTQVYPNGPVYPIMGTFQASQSALMPTTSTPYIVDTNLNTINVTTNNNDFYVETIPSGTTQLLIGGERMTQQAYSPIRTITRCEFTPTSCGNMFTNMPYVTQINLSRLNTSNATSTSGMFKGCIRLTSLIISNLDTSRVVDMSEMFYGCTNLQSLDLSSFHTGSVTDMTEMFDICSSLSFINLSTIRTPNVTIMDRMFNDCSSLTSLDLSHFDTSNVTQMNAMFRNCSSLTSLDLSNFDTTSVVMFGSMFEGCSSLTSLNLSNFTTQSVASQLYLSNMFLNVPSNCVITMNNVTNATFDDLTDYNTTGLDTSIIIFRDGARYEYDSTQDEWVQQQARYELLDEIHATQMDTYIDTLYTCTIDTRIEVRYVCDGQYQSDHPRLFSTGSSWSGSDTIAIDYEGNVNMYVKFNNTTDWNRSSGVTWDETSPHTVIYTHTDVTYDNNIVVSRAMTSFVTQPYTLCIGMLRDNNPPSSSQSFLKYIEFKLYESTTQTRNYVAAKRLSDNKYGMYDTLNDTFLSSAGSNEYTGTSKSTPKYIY